MSEGYKVRKEAGRKRRESREKAQEAIEGRKEEIGEEETGH